MLSRETRIREFHLAQWQRYQVNILKEVRSQNKHLQVIPYNYIVWFHVAVRSATTMHELKAFASSQKILVAAFSLKDVTQPMNWYRVPCL